MRPFLFGKLPAHGDFVTRGLEGARRDAWDAWASAAMLRARQAFGEQFDAVHDAAPPWRFVAGPSSLGADWRAGAVAASIDRAGRRFVIAAGLDGMTAEEAGAVGDLTADQAQEAIYSALTDQLTAEALLALLSVGAAGEGEAAASAGPSRWISAAAQLESAEPPEDVVRTVTAAGWEFVT